MFLFVSVWILESISAHSLIPQRLTQIQHFTFLLQQPTVEVKQISSSRSESTDLERRHSGSGYKSSTADLAKWHGSDLNPSRNVIDDADGFGVWVTRQAVRDDVVLHLPRRLRARFLPIDGFTCRTLKTSILLWRKINRMAKPTQWLLSFFMFLSVSSPKPKKTFILPLTVWDWDSVLKTCI